MTKINVATQLNKAFTVAIRQSLADDSRMVDPRRYVAAGRDAIAAEVARLLGVIGAADRAAPAGGAGLDGGRRR
jgi:fructose-bisphosphate aldolase class II